MTKEGPVRYEVDDAIARVTLDRPEKRNALDADLVAALRAALDRAAADEAVRVVAVSGEGKDFCAGADLAAIAALEDAPIQEHYRDADALAELFLEIRRLPKPVVAVVRGRALAGGAGLATACDLVVASSDARFGYPESRIGFVPAMVMAILRRNVSEKRAFELIAVGEIIDAAEAERIGLVNRVFAPDVLQAEATSFLEQLAARSSTALSLGKRLLYAQDGADFESAIRAGSDVNVLARFTDDTRAGIREFLEHRGGRERP